MSAKALFTVDGDQYASTPQRLAAGMIPAKPARGRHPATKARPMERDRLEAAKTVWLAIVDKLPVKEPILGFFWTDRMLRQIVWLRAYSLRYIQKGLQALEELELIERKRRGGRRTIAVVPCLDAGKKTQHAAPRLHTEEPQEAPDTDIPPADRVPLRDRPAKARILLGRIEAWGLGLEAREEGGLHKLYPFKLRDDVQGLPRDLDEHLRGPYRTHVVAIVIQHGGRFPARE